MRVRYGRLPALDFSLGGRLTPNAQVTNFFQPNVFSDLKLTDLGVSIEEPFPISGNADGLVQFGYHRVSRSGLVEFLPDLEERINQYTMSGAFSQYVGPDRFNVSFTYVRQQIDAFPERLPRVRALTGGTISYQLFRPLGAGRSVETGLGRQFETRGIDLFAGLLADDEHFTSTTTDVVIARRDLFAGVAVRGLKGIDVTIQPTWFTSRVSNDLTQENGQLRVQGNVLMRVLDEERTPGVPGGRMLGFPVAFVHIVVPFHWDSPRFGLESFASRRLGAELWTKLLAPRAGVTVLSSVGYSRQWFPVLGRHLNPFRASLGVGF
jgi:hypothetical protein